MKKYTFERDFRGDVTGFYEEETISSGGAGYDFITSGIMLLILSMVLWMLAPVWFFVSKHKIKKIKLLGQEPSKSLKASNIISLIVFIIQIISLIIGIPCVIILGFIEIGIMAFIQGNDMYSILELVNEMLQGLL